MKCDSKRFINVSFRLLEFRRMKRKEYGSEVASSHISRKVCLSTRAVTSLSMASYSFWFRTLKARRPVALTLQTVELLHSQYDRAPMVAPREE